MCIVPSNSCMFAVPSNSCMFALYSIIYVPSNGCMFAFGLSAEASAEEVPTCRYTPWHDTTAPIKHNTNIVIHHDLFVAHSAVHGNGCAMQTTASLVSSAHSICIAATTNMANPADQDRLPPRAVLFCCTGLPPQPCCLYLMRQSQPI